MNGQSAAKALSATFAYEQGSTTIPRKGSTILRELEMVNTEFYSLNKLLPKVSGIYCLYNSFSDKIYIGSARDINSRRTRHNSYLRRNRHHSEKLQRAYNLYQEFFSIGIIEETSDLAVREQYWMDRFDCVTKGYNCNPVAYSIPSWKQSQEAIVKAVKSSSKPVVCLDKEGGYLATYPSISSAARAIGDQSTNVSACCKGKLNYVKDFVFVYEVEYDVGGDYKYVKMEPVRTEEWKERISNAHKGKKHSVEHRRNLSKVQGISVCKYSLEGKFIKRYISISEASGDNGVDASSISRGAKKGNPVKGYVYRFSEDIV